MHCFAQLLNLHAQVFWHALETNANNADSVPDFNDETLIDKLDSDRYEEYVATQPADYMVQPDEVLEALPRGLAGTEGYANKVTFMCNENTTETAHPDHSDSGPAERKPTGPALGQWLDAEETSEPVDLVPRRARQSGEGEQRNRRCRHGARAADRAGAGSGQGAGGGAGAAA